ncbi:DUF179 domain-containing protein [Oecophyllibacter saccharovorans]|uniref:UPF0301 protein E3202_06465 n=1 Tax=Oecophyllibacter saccharovorans TaxID=2558360 RepID=A0A506ULV4_9PROT|nr:YqgE/AlgH family protein [Oecophyllibacter saccharovorans]TPW34163.1 DUF179 domain-containing protein [Oecophyllibacter saccharovorans]
MKASFISPHQDLTGRLLVASPVLAESGFGQTVIYLCSHSPETGAMGLVLNRKLPYTELTELLRQLEITPNPPKRRFRLGMGGPVEPGRGFVLHSADWSEGEDDQEDEKKAETAKTEAAGGAPMAEVSASIEILKALAKGEGPEKAAMFLGHAAWAPGQLEEEILHGNAWFIAPATETLLFGTDQSRKWEQALLSIGLTPAALGQQVGEA